MALTVERRNEISYMLYKKGMKHESVRVIGESKRNFVNEAEELGISVSELQEFQIVVWKEVIDEQMAELRKPIKKGKSEKN